VQQKGSFEEGLRPDTLYEAMQVVQVVVGRKVERKSASSSAPTRPRGSSPLDNGLPHSMASNQSLPSVKSTIRSTCASALGSNRLVPVTLAMYVSAPPWESAPLVKLLRRQETSSRLLLTSQRQLEGCEAGKLELFLRSAPNQPR
jgi:hypothetical protein